MCANVEWFHDLLIRRVYSSAVERLTADQQVPGSNPGVPFLQVARVIFLLPGGAGVSEI